MMEGAGLGGDEGSQMDLEPAGSVGGPGREPGRRKLVIMIPCFNEAETLPATLRDLPRSVDGYDEVEWLVVDDGSKDDTVEVARREGVDHIIQLGHNQGLAKAFMAGLDYTLRLGAHTIVNTDADNQYSAASIPDLVRPILDGEALLVIGARPIREIEHFSPVKKFLQRLGSGVVRTASGTDVIDAPSGFRAIHRDAAIRMFVFNRYTYTLETIIQAGRTNTPVVSVPVAVNEDLRPSRLVKSIFDYVVRSVLTIFRLYILYKPLRFFIFVSALFLVPGVLLGARYLVLLTAGAAGAHIQSLLLATILSITGVICAAVGILADLIAANRTLLMDVRTRLMQAEIREAMQRPRKDRTFSGRE